jgi:RND family efflux transporter MFP subunit
MTNDPPKPEPLLTAPHETLLLPPPRRRKAWIALPVGLVLIIVLWLLLRSHPAAATTDAPAPVVPVAKVDRQDLYNEVTIPGEFRPYVEAELHAKVSGYLDKINVDFGDKVKAGQLLAILEVPELHDELNASIAAEQRAEADYTNAHLIYDRLDRVNHEHPNLVAQQDIDTAEANDSTAIAAVASAKADVGKYQSLFDYTHITAPFDGVITRRYADPGALIQAGTSSDVQARALLRLSDNYRLRLDFPVSVQDVHYIRVGDRIDVQVESLGAKTFIGTVTRFTDQVNDDTRTMITEIEVPNPNLEIIPGMYATVNLKLERQPNALAIPIQAVPPGQTSSVYVIDSNNEIEERPITLGLETPSEYQVLSGLKEGELVLVGNRSIAKPGEKVEPKLLPPVQTKWNIPKGE